MPFFPFYRFRFFDDMFDPFFFYPFDFFDPWFDFDIFPPLPPPITQQYQWYKKQERLTYSSNNRANSSGAERRLEQAKKDNQSLAQFGQYRDPLFDHPGSLGGSDFQPRIVDKGNNQKQLEMTVGMKNFRPQEIKVSVKNNELIVQGEHQYKDDNRSERSSFFKSTTLPPGTQVDQLQSRLDDDGQLTIEGPVF